MADKESIGFSVEIDGIERNIKSLKDLKQATKDAKDEQLRALAAYGNSSKQYIDASKNVSELKDRVDDLNDSTKSLSGTGVENLKSGIAQLREGIINLDFDKVKSGLTAIKSGIGAFATSAKEALTGVKGALIATGIGAFAVLLGTIVAYWDDIKGLVSGVSSEQEKLNELATKQLKLENEKLALLSGQDNILKLQGLSEKEILKIKLAQTDEVIKAQELSIQNAILTEKAQLEAAARNKKILESLILFTTTPLSVLLKTIDFVGERLGQNFGLSKKLNDSITGLVFDEDKIKEEGEAAIREQEKTLLSLKNQRAGFQLQINGIDKTANDKNLADYKKLLSDKQKAEDEAWALTLQIRASNREAQEAEEKRLSDLAKEEKAVADAEWMAEASANSAFVSANAVSEKQVKDELRAQELESFKSNYSAQLQIAQATTDSLQSLSDLFFIVKNRNLQKGTAAELKAAEQQFKINKALAITSAVISGIQGVINALSAQSVIPEPFGTILKVASAVGIGIAAAANVAKIASTKFNPGGSAPSGGGGATTSVPIPSPPSLSAPSQNQSNGTTFDENGKKTGNEEKTSPTINVKATVGVDEVSKKQNRVESLEKQSTF